MIIRPMIVTQIGRRRPDVRYPAGSLYRRLRISNVLCYGVVFLQSLFFLTIPSPYFTLDPNEWIREILLSTIRVFIKRANTPALRRRLNLHATKKNKEC